jgi:NADPH:quinone reductase-like Zn-dependent oxidoreductase
MTAAALWLVGPDRAEIRPGGMGEGVLVRTAFSGISRGTERLVLSGQVPETEHARMRVPGMEGAFSFPVKYGYCNVGEVQEGTHAGRMAFALYPHQTLYRVPEGSLTPLPDGLPPGRAVLAANMETALNIVWDSGASAGDRIAIIGGGVVGLLVGYLMARFPGAEVTVVETNPARDDIAAALGLDCVRPGQAPEGADVVVHTSATEAGLTLAMGAAGLNATIVEASWFGARPVTVPLGGAFHSRRLRLVSSQVGHLPEARLHRWTYARRMAKALAMLQDDRLDALISGESRFGDLPADYARVLSAPDTLCHRVSYAQDPDL